MCKHVLCFRKGTSQIPADASSTGKYLAPAPSSRIYLLVGSGKKCSIFSYSILLGLYINEAFCLSACAKTGKSIHLADASRYGETQQPQPSNLHFSPSLKGVVFAYQNTSRDRWGSLRFKSLLCK